MIQGQKDCAAHGRSHLATAAHEAIPAYGAPRLQRAAALGEDDLVAVVLQPGHLCAPAVAHVSNKREIRLSPALCRCVSYSTHANTRI